MNPDTLDTREKELASKWLTPEYRLLEEVHEISAPKLHEKLAFAVLEEYQSAKRLEKEHNLIPYHQDKINDPVRQFDQVETTVSHLYRDPHPALGGKNYGTVFAEVLIALELTLNVVVVRQQKDGVALSGFQLL